jgi:hypothetical protein
MAANPSGIPAAIYQVLYDRFTYIPEEVREQVIADVYEIGCFMQMTGRCMALNEDDDED